MRFIIAYASDPDSALKKTTASDILVSRSAFWSWIEQEKHRHQYKTSAGADQRAVGSDSHS